MQSKDQFLGTPSQSHAALLVEQREANEKLLLAVLQAQEDAEDAHSGRIVAEDESDVLRAKAAELLAAAELRERSLGIIGHDLREPLNAMLVAAQLLGQEPLSAQAAWLAKRIIHSGRRIEHMIDQLANFTRARHGGGLKLDLALCDLAEICRNVVEELQLGSGTKVRLTATGGLEGRWDPDQLTTLLSNLIGNATAHALPGTTVLVDARAEASGVAVEVRNKRVAIAAGQLFSAFAGGAERSEEMAHLGLGLYTSREIALAHGGTLAVESSAEGTTFSLHLPRLSPG
jgi:signal transduction histidine kinase